MASSNSTSVPQQLRCKKLSFLLIDGYVLPIRLKHHALRRDVNINVLELDLPVAIVLPLDFNSGFLVPRGGEHTFNVRFADAVIRHIFTGFVGVTSDGFRNLVFAGSTRDRCRRGRRSGLPVGSQNKRL